MNVRKLSVNKACIFLAVLLLAAMVTVSVALYVLTQDIPLFGMYYCLASLCCFALFVLWCWFAANWRCSPMLFAV